MGRCPTRRRHTRGLWWGHRCNDPPRAAARGRVRAWAGEHRQPRSATVTPRDLVLLVLLAPLACGDSPPVGDSPPSLSQLFITPQDHFRLLAPRDWRQSRELASVVWTGPYGPL